MQNTLYMVVEHFKNRDVVAVYRRFRDSGCIAPEGLTYVSSWVDGKLQRCYQLMETQDRGLLDEWRVNWSDLVDFEVHAVVLGRRKVRVIQVSSLSLPEFRLREMRHAHSARRWGIGI